MSAETLKITGLGASGDGIAETPQGPVYVPFSCPGDTVKVAREKNRGHIIALTEPSPQRVEASCRHYGPDSLNGACGGCSLQHISAEAYQEFKRNQIIKALKSKKLDFELAPLVPANPGERRRAVFAARKTENGLLLGFNQAGSHHIVAIEECPVLSPTIADRLEDIKAICLALAKDAKPFRVNVLETLTGLDIAVEDMEKPGDDQRRAGAKALLQRKGIARLSINGEIIIEPVKPTLRFGKVEITPPPASFTQATERAEAAMTDLVTALVGKAKIVADLFSGSGTFALRLAEKYKVHAVEGDAAALKALDTAVRNTQGLKPVTMEKRDLFRSPLTFQELKKFDAVVFDPPRAGAEAQAKELALSKVTKVIAVSCNPVTLARDLSVLIDAGFQITSITPIDQFLWSPHVEVVAGLERTKK